MHKNCWIAVADTATRWTTRPSNDCTPHPQPSRTPRPRPRNPRRAPHVGTLTTLKARDVDGEPTATADTCAPTARGHIQDSVPHQEDGDPLNSWQRRQAKPTVIPS